MSYFSTGQKMINFRAIEGFLYPWPTNGRDLSIVLYFICRPPANDEFFI